MSWRGLAKRRDVTKFGDQCRRCHQSYAAQRLQRSHHRCQRPVRQRRFDVCFQTVAPCRRRLDRCDAVFQHDMMHGLFELQPGQPAPVHQRPGRAVVVMAVAQQEAGQLLASLTQRAHRRQTRTHEIADRLMGLIRNPDRGQFTGPMQLGEIDRIPPVGLDPLTGLARDQRRSNDDASVPGRAQLPLNAIAARVRPRNRTAVRCPPRANFAASVFNAAGVFAILPYSRTSPRLPASASATAIVSLCTSRPTYVIGCLHDPSPMHEARHRTIRRNPRKPAYCETGRPYLRRTSGLAWFERRATERKPWPEQKPAVPGRQSAHRVEAIQHPPFCLLPGRWPGNSQSAVLYGFEAKDRETQVKAFVHVVAGCYPPSTIARCDLHRNERPVRVSARHDGDEPPPTGIADRVHSNVLGGMKIRALVRGAHSWTSECPENLPPWSVVPCPASRGTTGGCT